MTNAGPIPPSVPPCHGRREMTTTAPTGECGRKVPSATYRLQLHRDFTFNHATALVPYLAALGISHCYLSPILKARAGSSHGYDIVDHLSLNPELGDRRDFDRLVATLRAHAMGLIIDVVPNHMGIGGSDNIWWLDVLENGPAAEHADFFDIDWQPVHKALRGKVLLPILGDHYGAILEQGDIILECDLSSGSFHFRYHEHLLPLDPRTCPFLLQRARQRLKESGAVPEGDEELARIAEILRRLPNRGATGRRRRQERRGGQQEAKARLAALCRTVPAVAQTLAATVADCNDVRQRDRLHALLEKQAYRLAYWRVAADEINYRRFFSINDLAGVRVENQEVFAATHRLMLELISMGQVDGLRIDHPDGLSDPLRYFRQLREATAKATTTAQDGEDRGMPPALYVVVEKILAPYERLPEEWPVHGTTGYDFLNQVNGLFTMPGAEADLAAIHHRFAGRRFDLPELLHHCKKRIIHGQLSSELTVLANQLKTIAETDRHTRDFTLNGLREAISETAACFPVYRTYVRPGQVAAEDRRYVEWAVSQAKKRSRAADLTIFDFLRDTLLLTGPVSGKRRHRSLLDRFAMKFQQYTAPVMAKAQEDTCFYIYNRLLSLNEVGGDPGRFHVSPAAFHHGNNERLRRWPQSMLATSTHDSKRSEDVRARLNVLSEIPEQWQQRLARWRRLNRGRRRKIEDRPAPDRNDEYHFYQTLAGCWPLADPAEEPALAELRGRLEEYMLKAVREAKVHTSWLNPDSEYEGAMRDFVRQTVSAGPEHNPFLADFIQFIRIIRGFGLLNSLSQTLFKLTAPGVPDIYQGNEIWDFSLVDPDNRRPVDYPLRRRILAGLAAEDDPGRERAADVRELLDHLEDGRAKLHLIRQALRLRQDLPDLFQAGDYQPLAVSGARSDHLCAFARQHQGTILVVAGPRWFLRLAGENGDFPPLGETVWQDTAIHLAGKALLPLQNILTGETVQTEPEQDGATSRLAAAKMFASFPVAMLLWPAS